MNDKNRKSLLGRSRTLIFSRMMRDSAASTVDSVRRDSHGRLIVPLYSRFFSSLSENVMCSNAMFNDLKEEIEASVYVYSAEEPISLVVYESSVSADDSTRESVLIGFRKYLAQYLKRMRSELWHGFILFLMLALLGLLIEFLAYTVFAGILPDWILNVVDICGTVLIWQFVGYLAFEFSRERNGIRRLKQLSQIEYVFRHWE